MSNKLLIENTSIIKSFAKQLGFDYCGISKAEYLKKEAEKLKNWLDKDRHGKMGYMANHFDKRLDPTKLVEGSKSVISLLYNYAPGKEINSEDNFKIARYAYGEDYHFIVKKKLHKLIDLINSEIGEVSGRGFVDSAPVMERQWAAKSGLGWIGKNTLLINKKQGSYFFIAELILDIELLYDNPIGDFCGTCSRCIDACPTQAISPYQLDASKCISYLTIELKKEIPQDFKGKMKKWIFGCDICQEVCPWNRFSIPHNEPAFIPSEKLLLMNKGEWIDLSEGSFKILFKKSAVKRTKYKGLKRNIIFI